jgi:hypothetical protein
MYLVVMKKFLQVLLSVKERGERLFGFSDGWILIIPLRSRP